MSGSFLVAVWGTKILIQVKGNATLNNSLFFRDFVENMLKEGFQEFIIDLALCKGMDSTFMGVLVGLTKEVKNSTHTGGTFPQVMLINLKEYHQKLLDNLGISQVLAIHKSPIALPSIPMKTIPEKQYDLQTRVAFIQEAHRSLVSLQSKYQKQFEEFLATLEQEVQRPPVAKDS